MDEWIVSKMNREKKEQTDKKIDVERERERKRASKIYILHICKSSKLLLKK